MAIEIPVPWSYTRQKSALRTERVPDVLGAARHTQGSALTLIDIDGTSFVNGQEANLASLQGKKRIRYSSRTLFDHEKSHPLINSTVETVGKFFPKKLQFWPLITSPFRQQVEKHTTEPGIYGLRKALLPLRFQPRVWGIATQTLEDGGIITIIGNSNLIDGRVARRLAGHAKKHNLSGTVTFIHVKP